jgi:hypothetical protein
LPEQYRYLQIRLQIEQQRFLNFGTEAGLLYDDKKLTSTLKVNRAILLAILAEVKDLMERFAAANGKYETFRSLDEINWNDLGEPETELDILLWSPTKATTRSTAMPKASKGSGVVARHLSKIGKNIGKTGRNLRKIAIEPKRLNWALLGKDKFEKMLADLTDLNDYLVASLEGSQIDQIRQDTSASYHEILQLRNDVTSLKGLISALSFDEERTMAKPNARGRFGEDVSEAMSSESKLDEFRRQYLKKLAEIKKQYIDAEQIPENLEDLPKDVKDTKGRAKLNLCSIKPRADELNTVEDDKSGPDDKPVSNKLRPTKDSQRTRATFQEGEAERGVWIEWKETLVTGFIPVGSNHDEDPFRIVEDRIALLTDLLHSQMPVDFRAPRVFGYIRVQETTKAPYFGLVLGDPKEEVKFPTLFTLHDLFQSVHEPPLFKRVSLCTALAQSLHNFHSVNWLHKSLRSNTVLYFASKLDNVDITSPFISGFELSRPDNIEKMTEKPVLSPSQDMYRHPDVQSWRPGSTYQKCYDVYSLGVLLIEIAYWQPIENILNLGSPQKLESSALFDIRERLLGEKEAPSVDTPILTVIASKLGDAIQEVVELCLRADEIERPTYAVEPKTSTSLRLQRIMGKSIVGRLKEMESATRGS